MIERVLARFPDGREPLEEWPARGNIHGETWLVRLQDGGEGLLQPFNTAVFSDVARVQANAARWSAAMRKANLSTVTYLPSDDGRLWAEENGIWRLMRREQGRSYARLADAPEVAEAAGRALALATQAASDVDAEFAPSLPGFRNPYLYWAQFRSLLDDSPVARPSEVPKEAWGPFLRRESDDYGRRLAEAQALVDELTTLQNEILEVSEERRMIHGDPKLENLLFVGDEPGAWVDLDTVMPGDPMQDWGDLARSLINPAGEWADPDEVWVDEAAYVQAERGYQSVLRGDSGRMRQAARQVILEQALRFLADHLRGDTYYRLRPDQAGGNLRRARMQMVVARALTS